MKVKPIIKKSARAKPEDARPVTCLSTSAKILNTIIAKRRNHDYEMALHDALHAYGQGRSTWTALGQLIAEIRKRRKCHVAILDMSKAFDKVSRGALKKAIQRWNLPKNEAELIINQYEDCKVFIQLNGKTSEPFLHLSGIRQGCSLSGIFWNLVLTDVHFEMDIELPSGTHVLISYADDIVIIGDTPEEIEMATHALQTKLEPTGLCLNHKKTIMKKFDLDSDDNSVARWLGALLSTNLTWDAEVQNRIEKANDASKTIKRICHENNLLIGTQPMINIIRSLVATHIVTGRHVIKFLDSQSQLLTNALTEAILLNTNLTAASAEHTAQAIWTGDEIMSDQLTEPPQQATNHPSQTMTSSKSRAKTKVVRKVPQSRLQSTLGNEIYVAPTREEYLKRCEILEKLQEDRTWCKLCDPPKQIRRLVTRNEHRRAAHKLPAEQSLEVTCEICKRTLNSRGYPRHLCIDQQNKNDDLVACSYCKSMFSKYGVTNHEKTCASRTSSSMDNIVLAQNNFSTA